VNFHEKLRKFACRGTAAVALHRIEFADQGAELPDLLLERFPFCHAAPSFCNQF
jgi:hypothetical protein